MPETGSISIGKTAEFTLEQASGPYIVSKDVPGYDRYQKIEWAIFAIVNKGGTANSKSSSLYLG